ncbi:TonB-dependent receptor [Tenacibaculum sp. SG-28]|uniref:TonB-dependent receptor n=1 Tax=Tenacibaculum sp. SG-28 TaxID=754426 RepID=UPI000CF56779|nr:TonB-dependent receptor [Tenacibaculum sp. SG-28]PQJ20714.1 TonB-dependent receptor [Tenacibaculum sp. SG-28]
MKQNFIFLALLVFTFSTKAQHTISGTVTDTKGNPVPGANIYLEGTYDGTSSDENGKFKFSTTENGTQTLVASFISMTTLFFSSEVKALKDVALVLHEDPNTLDAVTINAGTFEAGDNAKVTALTPLDVVTTASALGDFIGAIQTLPGTTTVEEDGRLFVRGGDANETQIFVDGLRVFTPYTTAAPNIPSRGRFSPFLFKGFAFSTGGYSAEYGQALSSVLTMNTIDESLEEKTDISLMTVGAGIGNTQIWGRNSFSINTSYINLAPYQELFPDRNEWKKPIQSANGEMVYRYRAKNDGLLKLYGAFSYTDFEMVQDHINFTDGYRLGLQNSNLYFNGTYQQRFGANWKLFGGISYTNDVSNIKAMENKIRDKENGMHAKVKLSKRFTNSLKLHFGAEYFLTFFKENFERNNTANFRYDFTSDIASAYAEMDVLFSEKLGAKLGVRVENSNLLEQFTMAPRLSLAYKTGVNSQVALAYGDYYQNPDKEYLKFSTALKASEASHWILNYQYVKKRQIFRVEGYLKTYQNLVKYNTNMPLPTSEYTNKGDGYARGIDIFWRDGKSIKNLEYWTSYSYLDSHRNYNNFPTNATPSFAATHNFSAVTKYFVNRWRSQLGLSYTFSSGRTYTNPNVSGFLNEKTKNYNSLSFNWAYLISQQKILYFSVNNVLGTNNVYGYRYKNVPNTDGIFDRQAILPAADRFFFVGFFWTISKNKKDNQLRNL